MKAAEGFAEQQTQTHHGEDNAGAEHYPNISLYTVPHRAGESEHTHHAEGEEQLESDHAEHLSGRRQSTRVFHSDTTQFTSRMGWCVSLSSMFHSMKKVMVIGATNYFSVFLRVWYQIGTYFGTYLADRCMQLTVI